MSYIVNKLKGLRGAHICFGLLILLFQFLLPLWSSVALSQQLPPNTKNQLQDLVTQAPTEAINKLHDLLQKATADSDRVWLGIRLANAWLQKGESTKAVKVGIANIKHAGENQKLLAEAHLEHALVLHKVRFLEAAQVQFKLAEAYLPYASYRQMLRWANNYGNLLGELGQHKQAIKTYEIGLAKATASKDSETISYFLHNRAIAYGFLDQLHSSEADELRAIQLLKGNKKQELKHQIILSLASLYIDGGNYPAALPLLKEADPNSQEPASQADFKLALIRNWAQYYRGTGQADKAADLFNEAVIFTDSLRTAQNTAAMAELQTKYDLARKDKDIQLEKIKSALATKQAEQNRHLVWLAALGVVVLLIFLGVTTRLFQVTRQRNKLLSNEKAQLEVNNKLLEQENILAQYQSLKDKLNPHFLFNMLTTLSSLIGNDIERAQNFLHHFSLLFRKMLKTTDELLITVAEEQDLINEYLSLMQTRHEDGLRVEINLDEGIRQGYLPPFTLQLVLENAIKHNIITTETPLLIQVEGNYTDKKITVTNTLQARKLEPESLGLGMALINRRYALISDQTPTFEIVGQAFIVHLPVLQA